MAKAIIIGPVRCVYPVLAHGKAFKLANGADDGKPAKSIMVLIPKTDTATIDKITKFYTEAVHSATNLKTGQKTAVLAVAGNHGDPANKYSILKDGDVKNIYRQEIEEKAPVAYQAGHYTLTVKMPDEWNQAIWIVDRNNVAIPGSQIEQAILSGYWVRIAVFPFVYANQFGTGLTLRLQGVQFVKKDEVIGAENPFDIIEGFEDDEENDDFEGNPFPETV